MDIIGCTHYRKLVKIITSKKCMTENLGKRDKKNSKKDGEIFLIGENWERNICDRKIT